MAASAIESSSLFNVSVQSAYRTTCDNCMRSKVRCSKDHPSCHRCLGQGVTCIYSPSRKLKKMIEYRAATQGADSSGNGAADLFDIVSSRNDTEHSATAPLHDDPISPSSVFSSANDRPYPNAWSPFGNDGDVQESVEGMAGIEGITQPAAALTTLHEPLEKNVVDWPTHQWSCSMEPSTEEAVVPMSPETSPDFISSLFASSGDIFGSSTLDTHRGISSTPGIESINDGTSKPSCGSIAASVLQSLESPGAPLQHDSQPSSAAQGRLRRDLDTVIGTNSAAMEVLHRISGCTCSVPGNHLVMISAVLFIVLAWYEACLGASDRACEQGVVKAGSAAPAASEVRRCDADGVEVKAGTLRQKDRFGTGTVEQAELVCIPPIQVGSLQLGVKSRRQVVAQIVLTELAKVTKVMEGWTEWSCGRSPTMVGVSGSQELEAQLQLSLRAALQTRIEKVSQAAERAAK